MAKILHIQLGKKKYLEKVNSFLIIACDTVTSAKRRRSTRPRLNNKKKKKTEKCGIMKALRINADRSMKLSISHKKHVLNHLSGQHLILSIFRMSKFCWLGYENGINRVYKQGFEFKNIILPFFFHNKIYEFSILVETYFQKFCPFKAFIIRWGQ